MQVRLAVSWWYGESSEIDFYLILCGSKVNVAWIMLALSLPNLQFKTFSRFNFHLGYNEHSGRTLSVERWDGEGEDRPSALMYTSKLEYRKPRRPTP